MPDVLKNLKLLCQLLWTDRRALSGERVETMRRLSSLYLLNNFSLEEIRYLGLLDPLISHEELKRFRSKESVWRLYQSMNNHEDIEIIDDKLEFYRFCQSNALNTIPILASLFAEELEGISDTHAAAISLVERMPEEFVVKPSRGQQGEGLFFFRRDDNSSVWLDDEKLSTHQFLDCLQRSLDCTPNSTPKRFEHNRLLFQPLVEAHPSLQRLAGNRHLQGVRVCTVRVSPEDNAFVAFSFLKIPSSASKTDNYHKGSSGNMVAFVDPEHGHLFRAIGPRNASGTVGVRSTHEETQAMVDQFRIPDWPAVKDLALRSADALRNVRAIGWDIGITANGPTLIEGNGTWDPLGPLTPDLLTIIDEENGSFHNG